MRLFLSLLILAFTAACSLAGPAFWGAAPRVVSDSEIQFVLRRQGPLVEVTRTTPLWRPGFADVARRAARVVAAETGCPVAWVMGDPAKLTAGLRCDGARAPPIPKRKPMLYCNGADARRVWQANALMCEMY